MATPRVLELRRQFETLGRDGIGLAQKRDLIQDLMIKLEREQPGAKELMEKERPIIAELMLKLKQREHVDHSYSNSDLSSAVSESVFSFSDPENNFDDYSNLPQDSVVSSMTAFNTAGVTQLPKRTQSKSPLEKVLYNSNTRKLFRDFIATKGASENYDFWMACYDCEHKARACASLAKKIISKLMKEIKESRGQPEQSHMDLALNSAVVAVRYELMLHKEETHEDVAQITDQFVRDDAPQRVNLATEKRKNLIAAVEKEDMGEGDILAALAHAQDEIRDWMEKKFYAEFAQQHQL